MSDSAREILKKTLTAIESETVPCERCNGYGYHHGFGEHGHDPDWCVVCGGAQVVPAHDGEKAPEILLTALSAAGFVIVPREPTEAMLYAAEAVFESAFSPESGETLAEAIRAALLAALEPKP